jgi:hypothetical protein
MINSNESHFCDKSCGKDCFNNNPDYRRTRVGYGDSWDGSATNQSNDFFIGHSGHVTILWHVTNNPHEKYDPSLSYHMPALDGSALYVWCSLHFADSDTFASIRQTQELLYQIDNISTIHGI